MRKKFVIIGAVIALLAGIGIGWKYFSDGNRKTKGFKTAKIERGDISATVSATGTLNAVVTVLVGSQVSGTIKELHADFNSVVKKGQVIARLDPALFIEQVNQARANLLNASANLEKAKVAVNDAKKNFERAKDLHLKGIISQSDFDIAQSNYESALAQMNAASAQVEQSKAARRLSEVNLSNTIIKAPVDGVVISRNVDVGQTVAASLQTPTLFTIAQDLTKMQINTNVDESDIGKIKTGQDVEFTVDAYPEKIFKGNVIQIRSAPIIVQNVVTYDVVVGVDNTDLKLKPGMTANVSILILKKDNVLKVPNTALRFKPPKEMETDKSKKKKTMAEQKLWILSRGKLQPIPIITGISNGTFTEILEGDIKEGQEVVVEAIGKAEKKQTPSTGIPRILR